MEKYTPPFESSVPLDDNLIIFTSIPDFSSSSLIFWEYIKENTSFKTVWLVRRDDILQRLINDGVDCCLLTDYAQCAQWYSKAKFVVLSDESRHRFPKPIGQVDVQLRSTMNLVDDIFTCEQMTAGMLNFAGFTKARSTVTDIFPVSSKLMRTLTAATNFIDARKLYITGVPRADAILHADGKNILFNKIPDLKQYRIIAFYCPTAKKIRDLNLGPGFDENIFNLIDFKQKDFEDLLESKNAAIVFKMHPADEDYFRINNKDFALPKHCFMIDSHTFWPKSLYHILNAFDIVVTENSSIANEFLLLDKPIIFNHANIDTITNQFRPIIDDADILYPGEIFSNTTGFFAAFCNAIDDPMKYSNKRSKAQKIFYEHLDGKSCERILDLMYYFTPIDNLDYEMFTQPLKEEIALLNTRNLEISEETKYKEQKLKEEIALLNIRNSEELENTKQIRKKLEEKDNHIDMLSIEIKDFKNKYDKLEFCYMQLESSKSVRYMRKLIMIVCPPNSVRRKLIMRIFELLNLK